MMFRSVLTTHAAGCKECAAVVAHAFSFMETHKSRFGLGKDDNFTIDQMNEIWKNCVGCRTVYQMAMEQVENHINKLGPWVN